MSHRTFVVNFISGPSAGKTTLSALVFAQLKIRGYVAEYVQEFAKQLVWTKDYETLNNQHYVSQRQFKLLAQMEGLVDFVVTDGPLVHGLYYNLHNKDNTSNIDKTQELILTSHNHFRNINIFLKRGSFPYELQGRLQTEEEAKEIDIILKHIIKSHGIPYVSFPADADPQNIERIVDHIISVFKSSDPKGNKGQRYDDDVMLCLDCHRPGGNDCICSINTDSRVWSEPEAEPEPEPQPKQKVVPKPKVGGSYDDGLGIIDQNTLRP